MSFLEKILILSPHTDDAEFGCGGLISKFKEENKTVGVVTFSKCEESLPQGYDKDTLLNECKNSLEYLKVDKHYHYDFKVREFNSKRQEILEILIKIKKEFKPTLILLPSSQDIHQDHKTVFEEGVRAFKNNTLWGYILPWNNFIRKNDIYINLNEKNVKDKIESIARYKSQKFRFYSSEEYLKALLKVNGSDINKNNCEIFELIRLVL